MPIVVGASRERLTLDLRGLGPAVRAHAKARSTTVSALARLAVIKMLGESGVALEQPAGTDFAEAGPTIKVTARIPKAIAVDLARRSRTAGLSYGAYLSTLIADAPVPQAGVDRKHAVTALAHSTDQLAVLAADLRQIARLAQRGVSPPSSQLGDVVGSLAREVRTHLGLAARLIADLQPIAAARRAAAPHVEGQRAHP